MSDKTRVSEIENESKPRKAYIKPHLDALGDLRSWTLGGSPGALESGPTDTHNNPKKGGLPMPVGIPQPDGSVVQPDGSTVRRDGSVIPPGRQSFP